MRMSYCLALLFFAGCSGAALAEQDLPHHNPPVSADGNLVVMLCDGETSIEVPGVKPGEPLSRNQAQWVADRLMAEWSRKHPDAEWIVAAARNEEGSGAPSKTAANTPVATPKNSAPKAPVAPPEGQIQTYGAFTERDRKIWQASTEALVAEGKRIFHDAEALGGTDAISCDMCHPDAANTHPETYPKYQVQLGRVALLRDMINWCIENPVRGKPLADDDPKMKALEAYIIAQRKGTALDYGKH